MSYLSTVNRKRKRERKRETLYLTALEERRSRWRDEKLVTEDETWRGEKKREGKREVEWQVFFSAKLPFSLSPFLSSLSRATSLSATIPGFFAPF